MDTEEKRACRREIINFVIQEIHFKKVMTVEMFPNCKLEFIKEYVRYYETTHYNQELKAY